MNDRSEFTVVGNEGTLRLKATAYDHQGNHVDVDSLAVHAPAGGRIVLTSLERGMEETDDQD